MMKDFLGNEYGPGDLVIYGAHSGRSINMVVGRVVSVSERTERDYVELDNGKWGYKKVPVKDRDGNQLMSVRIQPLNSSRWEQHDPRTYYVDKRTGEKIDRYEHVKEAGHYVLKSTGERLPQGCDVYTLYRQVEDKLGAGVGWGGPRAESYKNPDYVESHLRTYHPTVFEDYVEERREGPKPVTITVTENIVKWSGELPGE